jgi:21S rRNA (GM2251-2'-O)-methyltransferase
MRNILFAASRYKLGAKPFLLPSAYPSLSISRAASLNSAIGRGLRRSQGVGFRGKERSSPRNDYDNGNFKHGSPGRASLIRRSGDPDLEAVREEMMTRDAWRKEQKDGRHGDRREQRDSVSSGPRIRRGKIDVKTDRDPPPRRSRAARFNDPDSSFGKRSQEKRRDMEAEAPRRSREDARTKDDDRRFGGNSLEERRSMGAAVPLGRRGDARTYGRDSEEFRSAALYTKPKPPENIPPNYYDKLSDGPDTTEISTSSQRAAELDTMEGYGRQREWTRPWRGDSDRDQTVRNTFGRTVDRSMPLSIPYTTPASEFLYGTSVVKAALLSKREPRRKLYKLYVYAGENRENFVRDLDIERLARSRDVEVRHVDTNFLRVMDKMSASRPHNGYILEASPLPRLPVTSLDALTTVDGVRGFNALLDYQSREEASINGTSSFIPSPQNPFILLLDNILDPGNLGGIIRTASFLGVTAIAISTHNSAGFSPIVLKASAGASEDITIFAARKPRQFVSNSRDQGWKIYAAVAPHSGGRPRLEDGMKSPQQVTTDTLGNPLAEHPVILMIGNEGEGLRGVMRSKADVEVAIKGSGASGSVDSLNVSVATGILCHAFLKGHGRSDIEAKEAIVERFQEPERRKREERESREPEWKGGRRTRKKMKMGKEEWKGGSATSDLF